MAHSTLRLSSDGWSVECAIRALRSRYSTDRSTLTKIRVFVQSLFAQEFNFAAKLTWAYGAHRKELLRFAFDLYLRDTFQKFNGRAKIFVSESLGHARAVDFF